MIRRRSHGAVLGIGLLAAMTVAAQSQSWNLYNGDTSLPTIPFVGGAMSPTKAASVDLALGSASSPTPFVMVRIDRDRRFFQLLYARAKRRLCRAGNSNLYQQRKS